MRRRRQRLESDIVCGSYFNRLRIKSNSSKEATTQNKGEEAIVENMVKNPKDKPVFNRDKIKK